MLAELAMEIAKLESEARLGRALRSEAMWLIYYGDAMRENATERQRKEWDARVCRAKTILEIEGDIIPK